jgi:NAD(P)H-dependent flavin oxidoreductase YrpB (nitropropane dioxygenase family)
MAPTCGRDPLGLVASLTSDINALQAERDTAIARAVAAGATWAQIGTRLGVSAQAAHKRYRWLHHSPTTGETWNAPPFPGLNGQAAQQSKK